MDASLVNAPTDKLSKLIYNILVKTEEEGKVSATVWNLPNCKAEGTTREEAIAKLRLLLTNLLETVEIVRMEIELPQSEHPWMKFAGMYADNPVFEEVLANIEAYRRELDTEMEAYYRQVDEENKTK